MAKNLIPQIARMLGVENGEEFKLSFKRGTENKTFPESFKLNENALLINNEDGWTPTAGHTFVELIHGDFKIIKLPWRPKPGEYYYTYNSLWEIISVSWRDDLYDLCWQKLDLVFRTEEEALEERPHIYEKWAGEEWEE